MLDFTSALYLGLRHPSASLAPWDALTLGRPAALVEPPDADAVAGELGRLQGSEAATLVPSTLHLFWDLFRVLDRKQVAILCDAGLYPIARWGAERAAGLGTPVRTFPHHDIAALARLVSRMARAKLRPIVVSDGYCPNCGRPAPIGAYAELARRADGYLVLDDTQALGILGESPCGTNPYGTGGGGSLRWHGTFGPHIIVGSSLAKGFGAPLAALSGSRALIDRFREHSETRVHCSPPSVAAIHAAQRALRLNRHHGETLRRRLLGLVVRLRQRLVAAGLTPVGGLPFPVQSFRADHFSPIARLFQWLRRGGVRALLSRGCTAIAESLTFLVTARHERADIDYAAEMVASAAHVGAGDAGLVAARQILRAERVAAE
jgi:8-amino-7-oxononanoate synthase